MKKIISIIIAAVMALCLCLPAFAAQSATFAVNVVSLVALNQNLKTVRAGRLLTALILRLSFQAESALRKQLTVRD